MQTVYVSPEMEIVRFESEDVIVTSNPQDPNETKTLDPENDETNG